jgi:predicted RNase H-like HicB family nuclease
MSDEHRFTVRPLTQEKGSGWLVEYPDLPGCMSDGETIGEAIANAGDAKRCRIAAMKKARRPIPPPSVEPAEATAANGNFARPSRCTAASPSAPGARVSASTPWPLPCSPRGWASAHAS